MVACGVPLKAHQFSYRSTRDEKRLLKGVQAMNPALFERTGTLLETPHMLCEPISTLPQEFGRSIGLVYRDFTKSLNER